MTEIFFSGSGPLKRTLIIGGLSYVALLLFLRISGKRTLSKMNAFDFVVTVSIGSTLSAAFVSNQVDLAQAVLAIGYLIALQYVVAWGSVRSERFQTLIKAEPVVLVSDGKSVPSALRRERFTMEEIHAAMRSEGYDSLDQIRAVILETNGNVSVIPKAQA